MNGHSIEFLEEPHSQAVVVRARKNDGIRFGSNSETGLPLQLDFTGLFVN